MVEHFVARALVLVDVVDVLVDCRFGRSQPARYIKIEALRCCEARRLAQRRCALDQQQCHCYSSHFAHCGAALAALRRAINAVDEFEF